ncbi:unnamed protein product [Symbiodinium microadriaticum]|nr:unnamed protein product [Symbiodinium sp. KB8]CAE7831807.1 unnamed protein product [Symbiodinium microadriaticum]
MLPPKLRQPSDRRPRTIDDVPATTQQRELHIGPRWVQSSGTNRIAKGGFLARALLGYAVFESVGFAVVTPKETEEVPTLELRITAEDQEVTDEGLTAMLDYMDFVLDLPQASSGEGFQISFEQMTFLGSSQSDILKQVICWSCEPGRSSKFAERCKRWKIICPATDWTQVNRYLLQVGFAFYPPPCPTYLLTDEHPSIEEGNPEMKIFEPNEEIQKFAKLEEEMQHEVATHKDTEGHVHLPAAEDGSRVSKYKDGQIPAKLDVGFAIVSQGFDGKEGYLRIQGCEGDLDMDGLHEMMDFMDAFTLSPSAERGFSIMYDMRTLRAPSMQMVTTVAEWGAHPVRQKRWEQLNTSCKVIITAGLRFTLAKGILSTFFLLCPPVTRTYLMYEPDQPLESAVLFEP